jgi:glycosyltransferase involved in cell wall biosynthesis
MATGWRVVVALPTVGPLVDMIRNVGAKVVIDTFPVLRKELVSPGGILKLSVEFPLAAIQLAKKIRCWDATAVYVNTITIPVWLAAARLAGVPVLAHVHEAEENQRKIMQLALAIPLLLADNVVVNSRAAHRVLRSALPRLSTRTTLVYNGVPGPDGDDVRPARKRRPSDPAKIIMVGRLSPRKGTDVALDAMSLLLREGRSVHLTVCGSVFPGYEWYEEQLMLRIAKPDLMGHVNLTGYVRPTWAALSDADIVIVPSRQEPFGNTAVEGLLARRPVIASRVQGLEEIIDSGRTGILVSPGDYRALAEGIGIVLDNPEMGDALAENGRRDVLERFSLDQYHERMGAILQPLAGSKTA